MDITGEYRIAAGRRHVWDALNDPEMLEQCIPGCQSLEQLSENEYQARIAASIGPVRAAFDTRIRLENLNPPESYTLTGESKAGAAGFGRGSADVRLVEEDGATLLSYSADLKVGGKLAQVGSRLVAGATRKTADDFFKCLARELDESALAAGPEPPGPARRRAAWAAWIGAAVAAALLTGWILLR